MIELQFPDAEDGVPFIVKSLFDESCPCMAVLLTSQRRYRVRTNIRSRQNEFASKNREPWGYCGVVSGPFSETVRGRLAYSRSEQDRGFIKNRFFGNTAPTTEDTLARGILDWDVGENTLLRLRVDYADFDLDGQAFALRDLGPLAPVLQPFGVSRGSLSETTIGQAPGSPLEIGSAGTINGDSQEVAATLEHQFDSGSRVEVIGSFSSLDFKRRLDADFSPLDLIGTDDTEDYQQTSFSLRFLSNEAGRVRYIAGLYYQQSDLELSALTSLNTPVLQGLTGAGCQAAGLSPADARQLFLSVSGLAGQTPVSSASQLARAGNAAVVNNCTSFGAAQLFPQALSRFIALDQDVEVAAAYGQVDFELTKNLLLTLGLRYTTEDKQARQTVFATNFATLQPNPDLAIPLSVLFESTPHDFGPDQLERSEDKLTYSGTLQWNVSDQFNAYVSTSSGFKAGGFNVAALGPSASEAEFGPEEVVAYEAGVKTTFFGGRAQLNAAFFFTEIDDLQGSQFTGRTSFIVQNAAKAETRGVELDARFQPTKDLGVTVAAAYTDFEFTSFPRPGCTVQQIQALRQSAYDQGTALLTDGNAANDAAGFAAQLLGSNQAQRECAAAGINNLQGRTGVEVPDLTVQLGVDYHLEIGRFAFDTLAGIEWNDSQFRQTDLDPQTESGSFAKTNLALSLYRIGSPWKISLVGRNIFDKQTFSYINDTPLLDTARQAIVDKPRTFKVQLQYDFE